MTDQGYYRYASIWQDTIVFACEDDIWSVSAGGGVARRLTAARGECSFPRLSPDGSKIAFVGREEGHPEVFVIPTQGGMPTRLTYLGGEVCVVVGWSDDGSEIYFVSDASSPFVREMEAFAVSANGGMPRSFRLGHVQSFAFGKNGSAVVGRNANDPARWKRYRGGTAGDIWVDPNGKGKFNRLLNLKGNFVWPMWINSRIYFLSDHEGMGNIYSCKPDGKEIKRHTNHQEYFVRFPSTDGSRIVYTAGAEIYVLDTRTDKSKKIDVRTPETTVQTQRKFVDARDHLEYYSPNPQGHSLSVIARGQPFTMANWEGAVLHHGSGSRVRYRHCEWMADGERFILINDKSGYEQVQLRHADQSKPPEYVSKGDIGRVISLKPSPVADVAAIGNHRHQLLLLNFKTKAVKVLDSSPAERISDFSWSADGRWIAYSYAHHPQSFVIRIVEVATGKIHEVTRELRFDFSPVFDPEGKYLYFLSARDFYPVYDQMQFDLSFPWAIRPYLITLRKDLPSPFVPKPKPIGSRKAPEKEKPVEKQESSKGSATKKVGRQAASKAPASTKNGAGDTSSRPKVEIDFDGIADRILSFPVSEGRYVQMLAAKGRAFFSQFPVRGIRQDHSFYNEGNDMGTLYAYDFEEQRTGTFQRDVGYNIAMSVDNQTMMYRSRERLRIVDALDKIPEGEPSTPAGGFSRKSGWIDLSRINIMVIPREEWNQMYEEAWRLQIEHFWDPKMSDVDWHLVHDRYSVLIPRLRTRSELSDIIWEMQGELGTSHAYEMGGDYRRLPSYYRGFLGADLSYDKKSGGYRIDRIIKGDSWDSAAVSPLAMPGIDVSEGDAIVEVGGYAVSKTCSVDELLLNLAGKEVLLTIASPNGRRRRITVKTMRNDRALRYRNWVESNRRLVHEKTKGKVGYLHIPDMGPWGFAEFHRGYLSEFNREGLIVDVRYNRGGHVSSLLLEKLARKRVGYDVSRWGPPQPYPSESLAGPAVALTNQFAGSDGDIFSHCFKLYKLGPLVGKRTWGGVIGIWPRHRLVDGTITTQPEFSFWFADVGFKVENYGTDPDYDVDIAPHEYREGKDPQMEKALSLIGDLLKKTPVKMPDFSQKPKLTLPLNGKARKLISPAKLKSLVSVDDDEPKTTRSSRDKAAKTTKTARPKPKAKAAKAKPKVTRAKSAKTSTTKKATSARKATTARKTSTARKATTARKTPTARKTSTARKATTAKTAKTKKR